MLPVPKKRIVIADRQLGRVAWGVLTHSIRASFGEAGSAIEILRASCITAQAEPKFTSWTDAGRGVAERCTVLLDAQWPGLSLFLDGALLPHGPLGELFGTANGRLCNVAPSVDAAVQELQDIGLFVVNHQSEEAQSVRPALRAACAAGWAAAAAFRLEPSILPDRWRPMPFGRHTDQDVIDCRAFDERPWYFASAQANRVWEPTLRQAVAAGTVTAEDIGSDVAMRLVRPSVALLVEAQADADDVLLRGMISLIDHQYLPEPLVNPASNVAILNDLVFELPKEAMTTKVKRNSRGLVPNWLPAAYRERSVRRDAGPGLLKRLPAIMVRALRDPRTYALKAFGRLRGRFQ